MEEKKKRIYRTIMIIVLTAFVTFMLTSFWMYSNFNENNQTLSITENGGLLKELTSSSDSNIEKYLNKIKTTIDKYYLWNNNINEEDLKNGAIEGYVAGLGDEYTEYIPADKMKDYKDNIMGSFVGVGIYMVADEKSDRVLVYYPIPESPAEKAGIKSGDLIISVDGTEYTAKDFDRIASFIKGEEGTKVNLVIEREGERLSFDLIREKITTNPITIKMLENDIGYLKLPSFDDDTANGFKDKVNELQKQGAKKLIIDLRNNGGGIVDEAVDIADMFLDKGKTIYSSVDNKDKKTVTSSKNDPIFAMNVIILVNENSASASEILACSMQDNERAKLVGTKTYGKGIIQTLLSLADGSGLKITTEQYYTPKEVSIHKEGIKPDEEVNLPDTVKSVYRLEESEDTQLQKAVEMLK
ncbi:MAG TPA: S41 family peptidase [Clostridiales bacterium]|nr:S41 family peptidase [Clostridiales bacterium]